MGRYDIWERVPQTTCFKFDGSLPYGTVSTCMLKMKMLSRAVVMHTDHIILDKISGECLSCSGVSGCDDGIVLVSGAFRLLDKEFCGSRLNINYYKRG